MANIRKIIALFLLLGIVSFSTAMAATPSLKIKGFGHGTRSIIKSIEAVLPESTEAEPVYNINFIEDALWIIRGKVEETGYLKPNFSIQAQTIDGETVKSNWDGSFNPTLPLNVKVNYILFTIHKGVKYAFHNIKIEGLPAEVLEENPPESFFYESSFLIMTDSDKYYTPSRLKEGLARIIEKLEGLGYHEAKIEDSETKINDENGQVDVNIKVNTGKLFYVNSVKTIDLRDKETREIIEKPEGQLFTRSWLWAYIAKVRNDYYAMGYPDVKVEGKIVNDQEKSHSVQVDIEISVTPGELVYVGKVEFLDIGVTRESVLNKSDTLQTGEKLNIREVEKVRNRLNKLGIFESVQIKYEKVGDDVRNVIFQCKPRKRTVISLLTGYGSYELVRFGVIVERRNIWGLGHRAKLKAVQSFKSSSISTTYTVPEIFMEDVSAYGNAFFLNRQEVSFKRRELGGSIALQRVFPQYDINTSIKYNYEDLKALGQTIPANIGRAHSRASSIELAGQQTKLDSILFPTKGYQVFAAFEFALKELGGNVQYNSIEFGGAYHHPISRSLTFHVGLKHGFIVTLGKVSENIPFNKRFFLGGENTVRGYRQGQAAPKDSQNKVVGAESYILVNLELDQRLTEDFSVFVFLDSLFQAKRFDRYPANKALFSAGVGIAYRTLIGPIRFSYGRNLDPRKHDPIGQFHLSVGFPF